MTAFLPLTKPGRIQAVTFDVGGTLLEPWPSVGQVYAEVAAAHGCGVIPPVLLEGQFAAAWQQRGRFRHSRQEWFELVRKTFAGTAAASRTGVFFEALCHRFAEPSVWRVFDDVHPVLERLRARSYRLGVVSNWDERLRPLLEHLGLSRYFEVQLISIETGFAKPEPDIFHQAAARMALPPSAILHVGDSLAEDVAGARSAGWESVLLERGQTDAAPGVIASLDALT